MSTHPPVRIASTAETSLWRCVCWKRRVLWTVRVAVRRCVPEGSAGLEMLCKGLEGVRTSPAR
eukprot:181297-Pelagomonas_calceolata.AAC.2